MTRYGSHQAYEWIYSNNKALYILEKQYNLALQNHCLVHTSTQRQLLVKVDTVNIKGLYMSMKIRFGTTMKENSHLNIFCIVYKN